MPGKVSCIIPAYNEASTITDVVRPACSHPLIEEVIVVCDGCTDETAAKAREAGARVLEHPVNRGKGEAIGEGVEAASGDILMFLDADLLGFTSEMISIALKPVINGDAGMVTLRLDRWYIPFTYSISSVCVLGGQRVLRRALWDAIPAEHRKGYSLELALNRYAERLGFEHVQVLGKGLQARTQEDKRGFWRGAWSHCKRDMSVALACVMLYIVR